MREISYTEALREGLAEEMVRDGNVFLLGEDIGRYGGAFGVTRGLQERFGTERVINTPISEPGFVGVAAGAALVGSRPVVEIMFMDFITLAMDQLVNQAAKLRYVFGEGAACPMVVRTAAGAGRRYGPTHSQTLEAWFLHVPGIKIAAPATAADAKGLLKTAVRDDNPVLFLEHKLLYPQRGSIPDRSRPIPFGRARVVRRGSDVTIVAWSWMVVRAEEAADQLAESGVSAEVIDLRTLSPMDDEAIMGSVRKTGRLLIVEEGCATGGVSAEIGFRVFERAYDYLDAPVTRVASPDVPVPASPVLEDAMVPSCERIAVAAMDLLDEYG